MTERTHLTDNPEAEEHFAKASHAHKAIIREHAKVAGLKDAVSAPLAMVAAVLEQTFVEKNPEAPDLQRWVLAFLARMEVQVSAVGLPRE